MNIKYIHRILLALLLLGCCLGMKAQETPSVDDWSDVDFNDNTLLTSEDFQYRMVAYLFNAAAEAEMTQFDSLSMVCISNLLGKAKVNRRMYEYVLAFMLNGYANMGRTQVIEYLLNYPMLLEGEIPFEEGLRLDSLAEPYQLVRVGVKAPDFTGVTIDGRSYNLYDSQAAKTIVFFWSTDCEYCHDFMVDMRRNMNLDTDYELVTFALASSQEEVRRAVKKMRLPGYHFYDELRWEGKAFLDYHITSTPTVFLLDANKTIVCKPYDWEELKYWLQSNNISY